jgi:PAS domain S-box-containing protein
MSAIAENADLESPARVVLAALPAPVYTTDDAGRITFYNEAAARLWGREPVLLQERWSGAAKLLGQDGQAIPLAQHPVAAALRTGQVTQSEAVLERPDGARSDITMHCTPLFDTRGSRDGCVVMLEDVTARRLAERSQSHLSAIVESSEDAILSKNLDGIIQSWNKGAERIFGYTAEEIIGKPVLTLIPEDRHDEELGIIARIRSGQRVDHFETIRRRKDGGLIDISLTISPVRNTKGEIIGASKVARDISDKRRAEETKDLLLHEIKHRVKNTLGTVQAIASQTFRNAPREERDAFGARLRAMSEAHDLLTSEDHGQAAVTEIVSRAIAPFNARRFTVEGDKAALSSAKALLLAMAIHELGTNAVKYGALSNTEGRVAVRWHDGGNHLVFHWEESGGPAVRIPQHRGFGTNLIQRAMAGDQGSARFDYAEGGLKVRLEIRS